MFNFPWHYFILDRFMDPNLNEDLGIGPQLFLNSQISIGPTIPTKPNKIVRLVGWLVCPGPQFETPLVHSPWPPHPSISFSLSLSLSPIVIVGASRSSSYVQNYLCNMWQIAHTIVLLHLHLRIFLGQILSFFEVIFVREGLAKWFFSLNLLNYFFG
jgi:hypothetical protein